MLRTTKNLHRRLFRDDVVDYLIDCILNKRFVPGDRVLENQLAEELAIGKGAVREALRDLVGMGFLEDEPYKGHRIRLCTLDVFNDYYQARKELIPVITSRVFDPENTTSLDVKRMRNLVESMQACAEDHDFLNHVKYDLTFHRVFAEGTGNSYLVKVWEALDHFYWVSLHTHVEEHGCIYQADSHFPVLEAIEAGNVDRVVSLQIDNLDSARDQAEPILIEKGLLKV